MFELVFEVFSAFATLNAILVILVVAGITLLFIPGGQLVGIGCITLAVILWVLVKVLSTVFRGGSEPATSHQPDHGFACGDGGDVACD